MSKKGSSSRRHRVEKRARERRRLEKTDVRPEVTLDPPTLTFGRDGKLRDSKCDGCDED